MLALDWTEVDLNRRLVTFKHTKNGSSRTVPISATLHATLSSITHRTGAVFRRSNGTRMIDTYFRGAFERALLQAGTSNFRWHDLRHTVASIMAQAGAPLQQIGAVLGHKSFAMTQRYAHLSPDYLKAGVQFFGAPAANGGQSVDTNGESGEKAVS